MINLKSNIDEVIRNLRYMRRDQIPYAISLAVNQTAQDIATEVTNEMPKHIDKPTPFTMKAYVNASGKWKGKRANKRDLTAIIQAGQIQAEYLAFQVYGGTRKPKKTAILVPTLKAPRNQYGNLSRANLKKYAQPTGKLFHAGAKENKEPGVYRNNKKTIEMLAAYELETQYEPRFPIYKIAESRARQVIERNVYQSIQKALATAR
jgi:hypothetical protein